MPVLLFVEITQYVQEIDRKQINMLSVAKKGYKGKFPESVGACLPYT